MARYAAKERWCLTADGRRVVKETDPEAAVLYVAAGLDVDLDEAERLGLVALEAQAVAEEAAEEAPAPEPEPVSAPEPAAKAVHAADVEDKALWLGATVDEGVGGLVPQPQRLGPPASIATQPKPRGPGRPKGSKGKRR